MNYHDHFLEKIGCGDEPIYHLRYPHDNIDVSHFTKQGISKKAADLYEKGHSTKAISTELGISKTAVNSYLTQAGVELRTHSNRQLKSKSSTKKKSIKTAPYGFCLVDGLLHKDPREQSTLKLILKWAEQGKSHCEIARKLNEQKLKPRHALKWSQPTVGFIIKRQNEKQEK